MTVHTGYIEIKTRAENDTLDITGKVAEVVAMSSIEDGIACVFITGSTGAITTLEYELDVKPRSREIIVQIVGE